MLSRIVCRAIIGRSGVSGRVVRCAQVMPFSGISVHGRLMEMCRKRLLEMQIDPKKIPDLRSRTKPNAVVEFICTDIQRELNYRDEGMEESVEDQLMGHIRNESGIHTESDVVTKGIKEIITRHKLDTLSQEEFWELTDADDEDKPSALSAAVQEVSSKYGKYNMGDFGEDFNANSNDANDANDEENDENMENEDVMLGVLQQSCGMNGCEDADVLSAIKEAASQFDVEELDEKSAKYKSCVAALRAKFKGRPGVLSDQQLKTENDIQEIYHDLLQQSKLDDHEDIERVDEEVMAVSKKMLNNAKGKLSAVTEKDRSMAVQRLQKLFQEKSTKPSEPSKSQKSR